jgi:hypothetical protein
MLLLGGLVVVTRRAYAQRACGAPILDFVRTYYQDIINYNHIFNYASGETGTLRELITPIVVPIMKLLLSLSL